MTGDAIAYHDSLAAGWSGRYASGGMKRRAEFFRAAVLPRLAPQGEWLDVGCGSGVFSRMLAEAGASVTGLDGSAAMIEAARAAMPGARFEVGRIEEVAKLGARFDGAICLSVIEYVDDPAAALAAIAGRLKPGARLGLSAPNRASTLRLAQRLARPFVRGGPLAYLDSSRHLWTRAELDRLLRGAGLEPQAILGFDPVIPRALMPAISPSLWFAIAHKPA